jgi:hypothetical protein
VSQEKIRKGLANALAFNFETEKYLIGKKETMLDKLSPQLRHALIALLSASFTIGVTYVHSIHLSKPTEAIVGALITSLALIITPLTNQYKVQEVKA